MQDGKAASNVPFQLFALYFSLEPIEYGNVDGFLFSHKTPNITAKTHIRIYKYMLIEDKIEMMFRIFDW